MDAMELLLNRTSAVKLEAPAPTKEALDAILKSAVKAPDHDRIRPWRFVVVPQESLGKLGEIFADSLKRRKPDAEPALFDREKAKALRAPMIIVVAARPRPTKGVPDIEQVFSAAAAAQNMMLAAYAQGYGAMWKTGDVVYDNDAKVALGLEAGDSIVGMIYLGTRTGPTPNLPQPKPEDFVSVLSA